MSWRLSFFLRSTLVVLALLSPGGSAAPVVYGHGGGWGGGGWGCGHYGGGWGYGHYGGWGYGGFYRPYYGYGYGLGAFGLGLGLGYGLGGLGGYGLGGYGLGGYGYYAPYYGGYGPPVVYSAGGVAPNLTAANPAAASPPAGTPPPDNAAHLQLLVPEDAEVWFAGVKIARAGRIREFVSPTLTQGRVFNYQIVVRYTDAAGKIVEDKRDIQVRANDWFRIDFTRPPPAGKPAAVPPPS